MSILASRPEQVIGFDDLPGERRNCDLLALCKSGSGLLVVAVEAKADEPFWDCTVGEYFDKTINTGYLDATSMQLIASYVTSYCMRPPTFWPRPGVEGQALQYR